MPLYKTIQYNSSVQILIWKITEPFEQLKSEIQLTEENLLRLNGMKSEIHQRAFLSVRKLLALTGYTDFDLYYDEFGKPHLADEKFISITHSHHFSAIIVGNEQVGIDIEMQRDTIIKIAHKFVNDKELNLSQKTNLTENIKILTFIWAAKEAVFKIKNKKGISFRNHIQLVTTDLKDSQTIAELSFEGGIEKFLIHHTELDTNFTLVYAFKKKDSTQTQ